MVDRVVGDHEVVTTVSHMIEGEDDESSSEGVVGGGKMVTRCYLIPFFIEDVDECSLPPSNPHSHSCDSSTVCENTVGSYDCTCPSHLVSLPSSTCPGTSSSSSCCYDQKNNKEEELTCKKLFKCPAEKCPGNCALDSSAICKDESGFVECSCPGSLVGSGELCLGEEHQETIYHHPTNSSLLLTQNPTNICGCQVPQNDTCYGIICGIHSTCVRHQDQSPPFLCECDVGYSFSPKHGCVDDSPPNLILRGDPILKITQCDAYEELAVEVLDENSEEYKRNLNIDYSSPHLGTCGRPIGTYFVNYSIDTPWTFPTSVYVTRMVHVEDANECELLDPNNLPPIENSNGSSSSSSEDENENPIIKGLVACGDRCLPKCHDAASCFNTIGSYECKCGECGKGDGFLPILSYHGSTSSSSSRSKSSKDGYFPPEGYRGGSGCLDSCAPIIQLSNPNPKIIKSSKCKGILCQEPMTVQDYEKEMELVHDMLGEEFWCSSSQLVLPYLNEKTKNESASSTTTLSSSSDSSQQQNSKKRKEKCFVASDQLVDGSVVDVSDDVFISKPYPSGSPNPLEFEVRYEVEDGVGNKAVPQFRTIIIQELDLVDLVVNIHEEETSIKMDEEGNMMINENGEEIPPCCQTPSRSSINNNNNNHFPSSVTQEVNHQGKIVKESISSPSSSTQDDSTNSQNKDGVADSSNSNSPFSRRPTYRLREVDNNHNHHHFEGDGYNQKNNQNNEPSILEALLPLAMFMIIILGNEKKQNSLQLYFISILVFIHIVVVDFVFLNVVVVFGSQIAASMSSSSSSSNESTFSSSSISTPLSSDSYFLSFLLHFMFLFYMIESNNRGFRV